MGLKEAEAASGHRPLGRWHLEPRERNEAETQGSAGQPSWVWEERCPPIPRSTPTPGLGRGSL